MFGCELLHVLDVFASSSQFLDLEDALGLAHESLLLGLGDGFIEDELVAALGVADDVADWHSVKAPRVQVGARAIAEAE